MISVTGRRKDLGSSGHKFEFPRKSTFLCFILHFFSSYQSWGTTKMTNTLFLNDEEWANEILRLKIKGEEKQWQKNVIFLTFLNTYC